MHLPDKNIEVYLSKHLDLTYLQDDETIISSLVSYLSKTKSKQSQVQTSS